MSDSKPKKSLCDKIALAIRHNRLLDERSDSPVIVALSGGADSVALIHILHSLGFRCHAAHCNFHLRGEESNRDERHVRQLSEKLGIPLSVRHFDIDSYRKIHGGSVEMACRETRYEWFSKLKNDLGAQAIAVAHHKDDNSETMLLNLMRGTGIGGLTGMRYRNGDVVRPMLDCTRSQIETYLEHNGIDYVVDSTNSSSDYRRNAIRNKILPLMREYFPDADLGISTTMLNLDMSRRFYDRSLANIRSRYESLTGIDLKNLVENEPDAELLIFEWFRDKGLTMTQARSIVSRNSLSGRRFILTDNTYLLVDRGRLLFVDTLSTKPEIDTFPFEMSVHPIESFCPVRDPNVAYFDERLLESPIHIRFWQVGDRMKPFGMKGSKKVSDIFNDMKIPLSSKSEIPLLLCGDEIIWICGLRSSRVHMVTRETKNYVKLTYFPSRLKKPEGTNNPM